MSSLGYKHLLSEKEFLKVAMRARAMSQNGTNLYAIDYKDQTLYFKTRSAENPNLIYIQRIYLPEASMDAILACKSFDDARRLLKDGDLKVDCSCPADLFWGYKYIRWKEGTGLQKELRRPVVRNPYEQGHLCFPAGQMVLTPTGEVPIESLSVGDLVVTSDGSFHAVVDTGSRSCDGLLSMRVGSRWITSTSDHKFLSLRHRNNGDVSNQKRSSLSWNKASELYVNDFLSSTLVKFPHSTSVNPNYAWFLGLYLGDGTVCLCDPNETESCQIGGSNVVAISVPICWNKLDEYVREFTERGIQIDHVDQHEDNSGVIVVRDQELIKFCLDNGGVTINPLNHVKYLNPDVIFWSEEAQQALLSGFFIAGGVLTPDTGIRRYASLTWFNTNKQVMSVLCALVQQYAHVHLQSCSYDPFRTSLDRGVASKEVYWFRLTGADAYAWHDNSMLRFKNQFSDDIKWSHSAPHLEDGKLLQQIKEKKEIPGEHTVYSISVEANPSYIVNGVIVHNCKHLYLVLQLFPYLTRSLASKFVRHAKQKQVSSDFGHASHMGKYNVNKAVYANAPTPKSFDTISIPNPESASSEPALPSESSSQDI